MDRQALLATLTHLLEETTGERHGDVNESQSLADGVGLDSVDMFSLVVEMQTAFKIKIASEELVTVETVGDLLDLLQAKIDRTATGASNAA